MSIFHYTYEFMWSQEDQAFIARIAELPSLAAHGDSRGSSLRALKSVERYVAAYNEGRQ